MIITLSVWDILIICIIEMVAVAVPLWFLVSKLFDIAEKHEKEDQNDESDD